MCLRATATRIARKISPHKYYTSHARTIWCRQSNLSSSERAVSCVACRVSRSIPRTNVGRFRGFACVVRKTQRRRPQEGQSRGSSSSAYSSSDATRCSPPSASAPAPPLEPLPLLCLLLLLSAPLAAPPPPLEPHRPALPPLAVRRPPLARLALCSRVARA